jgi:hypothetical protein
MKKSVFLRAAKARLLSPDNPYNDPYNTPWICSAIAKTNDLDFKRQEGELSIELQDRVMQEVSNLSTDAVYYPQALAKSKAIPFAEQPTQWRQQVRHELVDRLIEEFEAEEAT